MAPVYVFRFFLFSQLVLLLLAGGGIGKQVKCSSSFNCGSLGTIYFPFTTTEHRDCGLLAIQGCDDPSSRKMIQLENGRFFEVVEVFQQNNSITIFDKDLRKLLLSRSCEVFRNNFTLPLTSTMASFHIRHNKTFYRCDRTLNISPPPSASNYTCPHYHIYHYHSIQKINGSFMTSSLNCSILQLPGYHWRDTQRKEGQDLFNNFINANISIEVRLYDDCYSCHYQRGGQCRLDRKGRFFCAKEKRSWVLKLGLGLGLGAGILCILIIIGCLILRCYKWNHTPSDVQFQSRNTYSNPDPECGSVYFGVPLFSCKELQEATNNFDHTRELGEGGFGTVYYGKLQDGREVAVKRLYEHNYRGVKLLVNEVEILTRLRHRNLVSLYGCTSCQSRELLVVYEYIPNGTVASHLHGNLAKSGLLPWAIRMKIAIETASALVYLHASDIIHRDVKTNNILLDNSFCVKVADFGLSRLFPNDVTHVSTAPQGTPGYVDPEYSRCYQLTTKSDVYSFGVVLIELISSMPAVDLTRHRDEINLADLAMKKIKKCAFNELVDPSLGFELDSRVKRMINAVVELAFQCLQRDRELRPSMDKVLEVLKRIESERDEREHEEELDVHGAGNSHTNVHPPSPTSRDRGEDGLLKNMKLSSSPNTVADKWESELTTPNNSI